MMRRERDWAKRIFGGKRMAIRERNRHWGACFLEGDNVDDKYSGLAAENAGGVTAQRAEVEMDPGTLAVQFLRGWYLLRWLEPSYDDPVARANWEPLALPDDDKWRNLILSLVGIGAATGRRKKKKKKQPLLLFQIKTGLCITKLKPKSAPCSCILKLKPRLSLISTNC